MQYFSAAPSFALMVLSPWGAMGFNGVSTGKSFTELEPALDKRVKASCSHTRQAPASSSDSFAYANRQMVAFGIDWVSSVFKGDCKAPPPHLRRRLDRSDALYVRCDYSVTHHRDITRDISCNYAGKQTCGQEFDTDSWNVVISLIGRDVYHTISSPFLPLSSIPTPIKSQQGRRIPIQHPSLSNHHVSELEVRSPTALREGVDQVSATGRPRNDSVASRISPGRGELASPAFLQCRNPCADRAGVWGRGSGVCLPGTSSFLIGVADGSDEGSAFALLSDQLVPRLASGTVLSATASILCMLANYDVEGMQTSKAGGPASMVFSVRWSCNLHKFEYPNLPLQMKKRLMEIYSRDNSAHGDAQQSEPAPERSDLVYDGPRSRPILGLIRVCGVFANPVLGTVSLTGYAALQDGSNRACSSPDDTWSAAAAAMPNIIAPRILVSCLYLEHPILLLEAGPEQDDRVAPSMGVAFSDPSDIQWNYLSVPQGALEEKIIKQSQGKVLGGSSAVNFQAWTRGSAADLWALEVGNERWSWSGMLPYFERSETYFPAWDAPQTRPDAHGCSSPIRVSHTSSSGSSCNYPLKAMVADVFGSAGLRRNSDINSGDPLGCGESACATYQGKRQWAASYPHGSKVTLWSSFQASKVLVVGERAVGVETLRDGSGVVKAMARREVIVCCGAQNSARLLLLGYPPLLLTSKPNLLTSSSGIGRPRQRDVCDGPGARQRVSGRGGREAAGGGRQCVSVCDRGA
ncbi:unnamed protein product [Diplocarpon coronariae]